MGRWLLLTMLSALTAHAEEIPQQRRQQLSSLLNQDCGSCHGLLFKGGLGPPLLPENLKGRTDDSLIAVILDGRPGTAMPPWREFLSPSEAAWLVEQLRNSDRLP